MKSARLGIAVGVLVSFCGGTSAFAQTGDKVELNIFGGLSYWGAKNAKTQAGNLINVKPDEGGVFRFPGNREFMELRWHRRVGHGLRYQQH